MAAGDLPAAIAEFERALGLDPGFAAARHALGLAWLEAGEPDRAIEYSRHACRQSLRGGRGRQAHPRARHESGRVARRRVMSAISSINSPPATTTLMLGELNYRAHLILRELADLVLPKRRALDIIDLGCGTGLTGAAFARTRAPSRRGGPLAAHDRAGGRARSL